MANIQDFHFELLRDKNARIMIVFDHSEACWLKPDEPQGKLVISFYLPESALDALVWTIRNGTWGASYRFAPVPPEPETPEQDALFKRMTIWQSIKAAFRRPA